MPEAVTHEIEIINEDDWPVDASALERAARTTLALQDQTNSCALTIAITDDAAVAALNRQFRGLDQPTDVLSFPADALPAGVVDGPRYLGDLVIAYPYASAQAAREGQALTDSLSLLVIHGTLHLLGYDHGDATSRAAMWAAQDAVLLALGLSLDLAPALESAPH